MNRYPKLLDPQKNIDSITGEFIEDLVEIERPKRSLNKEFLYFIAFGVSLVLFIFILTVGNLSDDLANKISNALESIPFLDLKISRELIKDLHFPNPVTSSILASNALFLSWAFFDLFRKEEINRDGSKDLFKESSSVSYVIHILILLIILSSVFFNWHPKSNIQITRIEFIPPQPKSKEDPPKNTKRKSSNKSIDQGKHDPKKAVKPPEKAPGKPQLPPKAQQAPAKPQAQPKAAAPAAAPKQASQPKQSSSLPPLPLPKIFTPQPKIAKEGLTAMKPSQQTSSLPRLMDYSPSGSTTGSASPSPKSGTAATAGGEGTSDVVARLTSIPRAPDSFGGTGAGGAMGADGNPGPNNYPDRAPGVAAQADVNFGPYMSLLQRKIKRMWKPPRGSESNRIVVTFSVTTDGRLQNLKLTQSCPLPDANMAALDAVTKAAPFDPLPIGSGPSVDIEFTFDYNVFQKSRW